jgi:hypothetical protein
MDFHDGTQSAQSEIDFENKKLAILEDSYTKRLKLYKKDSTEYTNILSEKLTAEAKNKDDILKIRDAAAKTAADLMIKEATNKFVGGVDHTVDEEVEFQKRILAIQESAFDYRLGLYKQDSDEYKKILSEKEKAESDTSNNIIKIYEKQERVLRAQAQADNAFSKIGTDKADLQTQLDLVTNKISPQQAEDDKYKKEKEQLQSLIDAKYDQVTAFGKMDEEYQKSLADLYNTEDQLVKLNGEHAIKTAEEVKKERMAKEEAVFAAAANFASAFQEVFDSFSQARVDKLTAERDADVAAAGNNAAAKTAIEKEYNNRINKEKRKQAVIDKGIALFNVAINTAQAVTKAYADMDPVTASFFAALIIAQGVIQAAVIAAKPLPQFKTGTQHAPAGPAVVGEEGYELVERNGRMFISPNKASVMNLKGGERIYSHKESTKIIENSVKVHEMNKLVDTGRLHSQLSNSLREGKRQETIMLMRQSGQLTKSDITEAMQTAFKSQTVHETHLNERELVKYLKRKDEIIKYNNSRYSS